MAMALRIVRMVGLSLRVRPFPPVIPNTECDQRSHRQLEDSTT